MQVYHCYHISATKDTVDIEDLVDDFATFYIAGELVIIIDAIDFKQFNNFLGQETTGNMLSFALAVLHLHPHLLDRYVA